MVTVRSLHMLPSFSSVNPSHRSRHAFSQATPLPEATGAVSGPAQRLRTPEAAAYLGLSQSTLEKMRLDGSSQGKAAK